MEEVIVTNGKRFSGSDWYSEQKEILLVGCGGIGSWLALNLSRIGHSLSICDMDIVDISNVEGGQMFRKSDVGASKVDVVVRVCREFGCTNSIDAMNYMYTKEAGSTQIVISGLDNMSARKEVFETWEKYISSLSAEGSDLSECLLMDGRLTMEMFEIFTIRGNDEAAIEKYKKDHLFSDEESILLDCSTKQSTFGAMGIASFMTATLCNFLTNNKLGIEMREIPFYNRFYLPMMLHTTEYAVRPEAVVELYETIKEEML